MRARVYIATTEGPVLVQRLAAEKGLAEAALSAVCLNGTTTRLPITGAYTYFVRDHVRDLSGHDAYRLDLDGRIDGGSSWTLGVWIAHLLLSQGRLAMRDDDAQTAIFATGEVAFASDAGRRAEVRPVAQVEEKAMRLAERMREETAEGRRVLLVVPAGNAAEAKKAMAGLPGGDGAALHGVSDVRELPALLTPNAAAASAAPREGRARRRWTRVAFALALCAVAGGAAAGYFAWRAAEGDWNALLRAGRYLDLARSLDRFLVPSVARRYRESLRSQMAGYPALSLEIAARRPEDGGSCAGRRFRGGGLVDVPVAGRDGVYALDRPDSVCGFSVRASGDGTAAHAWLLLRLVSAEGVREKLMPARRAISGPLTGDLPRLTQDLPLYLEESWAWSLVVVRAPTPSEDVERLLEPGGGIDDRAVLAGIEDFGVSVIGARIVFGRRANMPAAPGGRS
ncbi:MAG: hypothetical protein OXP07_08440 [Defluviicoccus sp.]|nr:hypothetical protein [Defluviicoccus sp.]